jgi:hypothetical protein
MSSRLPYCVTKVLMKYNEAVVAANSLAWMLPSTQ